MALLDALKDIYGNGGAGDPLIGIGMGLLSQRGIGLGLSQGFQNVAATSELANQRNRQASLDKLAADREARQQAWQEWQQKNQLAQQQAAQEQQNWQRGFQEKQFGANQANIAADNARADLTANRPFQIGVDKFGHPILGTMQNGVPTPIQSPQLNAAPAAPVSDLHGEEYLKTVDPEIQNQVKAIAEGRAPYPSQTFMKTPLGEQIVNGVQQYEPGFDATRWRQRSDAISDLTKGKMGQNNNALNTAIGHLSELSDDASALNNYQYPMVNEVKNLFNSKVLGKADVTNFNTVRDKVAEEFTKVYRGSGGSEADIKREIDNLSAANSPEQLHGAIARMARLAQSKIDANQEQYSRAMGPQAGNVEMVSPKAKAVIDLLSHREAGDTQKTPKGNSVSFPSWSIER